MISTTPASPPSPRLFRRIVAGGLLPALAMFLFAAGCDQAQSLDPTQNGDTRGNAPGDLSPSAPGFSSNDSSAEDGGNASGDTAAESVSRAIEEADIVKVDGDKLYALNRYKGLLIVDVQDPDNPALLGQLDLKGRGVEMYLGGAQAYVLLSADYYTYYDGGNGFGGGAEVGVATDRRDTAIAVAPDGPALPQPDFSGSQLAIVDISDPTKPSVDGKINLVGYANESRRVGDIIYVIGSGYAPYFAFGAEDANSTEGQGFVASINVADPANIEAVQRKSLTGSALTMHTSDSAIFAASQNYDYDTGDTLTDVQIIDISDPAGEIALRGTFQVPGFIRNRFHMDAFGDTFRIATDSWGFGFRQARLFTYDIADMDDVKELGSVKIIEDETLQAVRFDGERAYAVTFLQVDPLFVIDLSDPTNPTVAGQLEVPGFSTHIEPRGNRLIAVGIDDTDGNRPAISYYDVEDPAAPKQLGRVVLGPPGSYTTSDATYDEKAFKIIDELGLIVVPYQHVEWGADVTNGNDGVEPPARPGVDVKADAVAPEFQGPACTNGVQLVDFSDKQLVQRGSFENAGNVSRVGVIGERLFALSEFGLKTVNIDDRDNPKIAGDISFFEGEDMARFGGCGYIYYPGPFVDSGFPIDVFPLTSDQIDRLIALAETCANGAPLPGAALLMMLCFSRGTIARRYRRRR